MVVHRLDSVRSLARFLTEHPEVAQVCQFRNNRVPSYRTLCRRFSCLNSWILQWCRVIITSLIDAKILKLKVLIIDGTPNKSKCKKPREWGGRTRKSDPEARFGCTGKGKKREWFFGYKSIILATPKSLIVPLAWQVIPANLQEVNHLIPVVSKAAWLLEGDKKYELIGDSGFDSKANYDWTEELRIRFTCPLRQRGRLKGQRLERQRFYKSKQGKKFYKRRTDIERLNGHLKALFLIDPFPVKGLQNVNTYLSLVMLLYLVAVYYNFTNGRNLREIKSLIA